MAHKNHKAILVDVHIQVRVIIHDEIDPDSDKEFDEMITERISTRIRDEGSSFIGGSINDYNDDEVNPYNPEYDIHS